MKPRLPAVIHQSPVAACPPGFCFVWAGSGQSAGISGARIQAFGVAARWLGGRAGGVSRAVCVTWHTNFKGLACLRGIKGKEKVQLPK